MNDAFEKDLYRYTGGAKESFLQRLKRPPELKYIALFRKSQAAHGLRRRWQLLRLTLASRRTGIQIHPAAKIGEGFYIGHFGRIIINPEVVIGRNVNLSTGVTLGQENRGKREGSPVIGSRVWIGTNSVIVGRVSIGDDVLIAPLSFVNFDVPSHSIVVGNPARIIHRDNATEGYINQTV